MFKTLTFDYIVDHYLKESVLFVDLRSEAEYHKGTITGAENLPVFNSEERKQVGILYDQGYVQDAKFLGVDIMARKLPAYYRQIITWTKEYDHVILFCSRGGYRSEALFQLLVSLKCPVERIEGGYKAYRHYVIAYLNRVLSEREVYVLDGYTGCGKTEILQELQRLGHAVITLETLANHRGSLLGHIGLGPQPTQKQFESDLFHQCLHLPAGPVFIEGESAKIGQLYIPRGLDQDMRQGHYIEVTSTMEARIKRIKEEYVSRGNEDELIDAVMSMKRYLTKKKLNHYIDEIKRHEFDEVIGELMAEYYDKKYKVRRSEIFMEIENKNSRKTAEVISDRVLQEFDFS